MKALLEKAHTWDLLLWIYYEPNQGMTRYTGCHHTRHDRLNELIDAGLVKTDGKPHVYNTKLVSLTVKGMHMAEHMIAILDLLGIDGSKYHEYLTGCKAETEESK